MPALKFEIGDEVTYFRNPKAKYRVKSVPDSPKGEYVLESATKGNSGAALVNAVSISFANPVFEAARLAGYEVPEGQDLATATGIEDISAFSLFSDTKRKLVGIERKRKGNGTSEIAVKTAFWTQMYGLGRSDGGTELRQNFWAGVSRQAMLFRFVDKVFKKMPGMEEPIIL